MSDLLKILADDDDGLYAAVIKNAINNRTLIINQEITDAIIEDYVYHILNWNKEDKNIPVDKRTPITILVNSPGGDMITGGTLMDVIRLSKTPIRGIGLGLIASAAYHIYLECHQRYAFPNSVFLQHDGEIHLSASNSKVKDTVKFFDQMDLNIKERVLQRTTMTEEYYDKIYATELYMYAEQAKEFGVVDKIVGIDCDIDEIL